MINKNKFKIAILKKDKSYNDVANTLNINVATLYRKINGTSDFYRNEMDKISNYLDLSLDEKEEIFFGKNIT